MADFGEVKPVFVGNHIELIGRRELNVAPHVVEDFGQLRFHRLHLDQFGSETFEKSACLKQGGAVASCNQLGQLGKFEERTPLGDSLGAESHMDIKPAFMEKLVDFLGGSREYR